MKRIVVIGALVLALLATTAVGCPQPQKIAEFEVTDLTPAEISVAPGESVAVEVTVKNVGEARGSYEVELKVNDEVYASETVTLEPNESTTATFTVSMEKEGIHEISADGKKATITVAAIAIGPEELLGKVAAFMELLHQGEFEAAVEFFDETMKAVAPAPKLEIVWDGLTAQLGPFKFLGESRVFEEAGFQIVLQRAVFERGELNIRVAFDQKGRISGLFFQPPAPIAEGWSPPDYVDEAAFVEVEVVFGIEGWELPGTLSLPEGEGPFPAVVLVHGSGPHDRDHTIFGVNKPFRDLAWGLATRGIAVLRYEKRTKYHAEKAFGIIEEFTVQEETIDDALAAVAFLRQAEEVAPKGIFILGLSLGGMLAPRIAAQDKDIGGLILLAANTRSLPDMILEQTEYLIYLDGKIDEFETRHLEWIKEQVRKIRELDISEGEIVLGASKAYWQDLMAYDQVETAKKLNIPILILQGGRDFQVTVEDFEGWQQGLAGLENVEFKLYSDLNHLFITGRDKPTPEEYVIPGNVAEAVVREVAHWIKRHSG